MTHKTEPRHRELYVSARALALSVMRKATFILRHIAAAHPNRRNCVCGAPDKLGCGEQIAAFQQSAHACSA